mmetsp:Transcript_10259/g.28778  ORF Transcript_10259/g.28778 Transcript_10259/m.28778 type:complete len:224 (-) Transcript_10259:272-943(-)
MAKGNHHPFHLPQHVELDGPKALLKVRVEGVDLILELDDLGLEGVDLLLLLGGRGISGIPPASGALDLLEQIAPAALELLIVEGNVLGRVGVKVRVADGLGLHLAEAVEVELAGEGRELVVVKVLGDNFGGEEIGVLDNEHLAVLRPTGDGGIARVDHLVCFLQKDGDRRIGRDVGIARTLLLLPLLALGLLLVGLGRGGSDGPDRDILLPGRHGSHPPALAD